MRDFSFFQRLQNGNKSHGQGASESAFFASLGIAKRNGAALEIDEIHDESGFAQAASRVHGNMKTQLHPFGFDFQQLNAMSKLLVGDFNFLGSFVFGDAHSSNGVGRYHSQARGLSQDHFENLDIFKGCVFMANSLPCPAANPPSQVFLTVSEFNNGGVMKPINSEPVRNMFPTSFIIFQSGVGLAMQSKPAIDPAPSFVRSDVGRGGLFNQRGLGSQDFSLSGFDFIFDAKACVYGLPLSSDFRFQHPVGTSGTRVK